MTGLAVEALIAGTELLALLMMTCHVFRIAVGAGRAWRRGWSGIEIGSWVTNSCFWLGFALAGAVLGCWGAFTLGGKVGMQPTGHVIIQLVGGLICAEVAAQVYGKWLAAPVTAWFSGEEAKAHGG